jgi:hypothetical protein
MAETENSAAAAEAIEIVEPTDAEKQASAAVNEATAEANEGAESTEDISYHAVEKEGSVTAIWEMQGRKHLRTIDPRSGEGKQILALFETAG